MGKIKLLDDDKDNLVNEVLTNARIVKAFSSEDKEI